MGVTAQRTSDLDELQKLLVEAVAKNQPHLIEISMDGQQQAIIEQIPWLQND